jgi:hypothetical protein
MPASNSSRIEAALLHQALRASLIKTETDHATTAGHHTQKVASFRAAFPFSGPCNAAAW